MFISAAYAAGEAGADVSGAGDPMMLNLLFLVIMIILFYVLLIMPQQRRFKEHKAMLDQLKTGDKVLTAGGLIGKVDKAKADNDNEIVIDLGHDVKVTVLRSMVQNKIDDTK